MNCIRPCQVRLYRCNSTDWDGTLKSNPRLGSALEKKWSGKCASPEDIDKFVAGLGVNVWFRLEAEDFKDKRGGRLKPPRGCK